VGTDVSEIARQSCPCGGGEIVVYLETPDHGWSSGQWQRQWGEIRCGACANEFVVQTSGRIKLVRRSDLEAQRQKAEKWTTECDLVLQSEGAVSLFKRLIARLQSEPSIASVWRLLSEHQLTRYSESAFRKHWRGAEDWVTENKSIFLLERILASMQEPDAGLMAEVQRLNHLASAKNEPVPAMSWNLAPREPPSGS
jgi:hypothetical protein